MQVRQHICNVTLRRFRTTIFSGEKAKSITYSEYVFVALGILHAMRMHHIVICELSVSTKIFFSIISQTAWLWNNGIEREIYVSIVSTTFV